MSIESVLVEAAVAWLGDPASAHAASSFPHGQPNVDSAGLYSWWADDAGLAALNTAFEGDLRPLIYAGQAGATSSRSGTERVATLRSRIGGNHLRGNIRSSTFRRTLTAALREPLGLRAAGSSRLDAASNAAVSEWIRDHLKLATYAVADRSTLGALEHGVLLALDPPLNLMGMPVTRVRTQLRALRGELDQRGDGGQ